MHKVPEAAKRLGISKQSMWKLIYSGRIPFVRVMRSIRVRDEDITAFINANRTSRDPEFPNQPSPRSSCSKRTARRKSSKSLKD